MAREFVRDPNTGKPAIQVINYEVVEIEVLQNAVNNAQAEYDAAKVSADEANERLSRAETGLGDAKSELEAGEAIASGGGADEGSEAASGEDSSGTDEAAPSFVAQSV